MSNNTATRPASEIQQEYQNLAFKAGNLQYELSQKTKDLAIINEELCKLSMEYVASSQAAEASKASEPAADAGIGTA